jgi:hypothetical protein
LINGFNTAFTSPKISATRTSVPTRVEVVPAVLSIPGTINVATHRLTATTATRMTSASALDIGISPSAPG